MGVVELNPDMNMALQAAGQQQAPMGPPQGGPQGAPQSPVFEAGAAMLQAFQQDPSETNSAALTAIMVKAQELLQGTQQQPQGQPPQGGQPPMGGPVQ
jgi:hypothetical protein